MMWPVIAGGIVGGLLVALWPRPARAARAPIDRTWREVLLECVRSHADAGTLYQWGGGHGWKDPEYGLDCSGLVTSCARAAGIDVRMTSDMMFKELPEVEAPEPGDLAVYGSSERAIHVRVVDAWFPDEGRAATIGSEGGGSKVDDAEEAQRIDARVKRQSDHRTGNFLGFRTLENYEPGMTTRSLWVGAG